MDFLRENVTTAKRAASSIRILRRLEDVSGVPAVFSGVFFFISTILFSYLTLGKQFILNVISLFGPVRKAFAAVESEGKADDTEMLTYFVVFNTFALLEIVFDHIAMWWPNYALAKFIFLQWCFRVKGAQWIYENIAHPLFLRFERVK